VSKQYFDEIASSWDDLQQSYFSDNIREKAIRIANVHAGAVAADIGAGTGYVTYGLLKEGLNVIAVDQSSKMIDEIQKKFENLPEGLQLTCLQGESEDLPIESDSVDYVFANMYLHHVENPKKAIQEMARVLKIGGTLVITDMDRHDFDFLEKEHYDRWKGFERKDVLEWLFRANLSNYRVVDAEEKCSSTSTDGELAEISIFIASGKKLLF
jgi:ubiquinone/menaquinone biosynthesis C-methylase UbiE